MKDIIDILLFCAFIFMAWLAEHFRQQRDNLAAAWIHAHPEDFPDLEVSD